MLVKAVKEAERASDYMEEHIEISKELSMSVEKPFESDYMLLGRLASDCEYYLGWGGGAVEALYYHDERMHIEEMKKLYEKLPVKPEWLTLEQLKEYEKLLLNKETDISSSVSMLLSASDFLSIFLNKSLALSAGLLIFSFEKSSMSITFSIDKTELAML